MKFIKSNLLTVLVIIVGLVLLALQAPVTKAITKNSVVKEYQMPSDYLIPKTWNLPEELNEISGITWIENNTFACIQDEDGIIFIYDIEKSDIVDTFKFAEAGDYEGIAIVNNDAYVMRSDGLIYEVKNFRSEDRKISEFQTVFSSKNNMESLTFDAENQRFLTTPKDMDLANHMFKNIYQIPLKTKTMESQPIVKINLTDDQLKEFEHKNIQKTFNPSDIAIHPKTKEIYVLEGKKPKLLILDTAGNIKKVHKLDDSFAQPEGITFSSDGTLYISNEAGDVSANIMEVHLN